MIFVETIPVRSTRDFLRFLNRPTWYYVGCTATVLTAEGKQSKVLSLPVSLTLYANNPGMLLIQARLITTPFASLYHTLMDRHSISLF